MTTGYFLTTYHTKGDYHPTVQLRSTALPLVCPSRRSSPWRRPGPRPNARLRHEHTSRRARRSGEAELAAPSRDASHPAGDPGAGCWLLPWTGSPRVSVPPRGASIPTATPRCARQRTLSEEHLLNTQPHRTDRTAESPGLQDAALLLKCYQVQWFVQLTISENAFE